MSGIIKKEYIKEFWSANIVELFERAAYYGMFISLTIYLSSVVGFTDIEAGWISGIFAAFLYFTPTFSGAWADIIGFRKALLLAFTLLFIGYALLGLFHLRSTTIMALAVIMLGGSFVKSIITATVAKCSDTQNRARAFSIFYQMVNIGAFLGKSVAKPIRIELGVGSVSLFSSGMCIIALLIIFLLYRNVDRTGEGKTIKETWDAFIDILKNIRFMTLILIVGCFWAIQHQLYATMPKYVIRTIGESASPEWYANVNPLVVVLLVVPITVFSKRFKPAVSIAISLLLISVSSFIMTLSPGVQSLAHGMIDIAGKIKIHPVTFVLILGIAVQALAECFLSPRFLEYASLQAPRGKTGLYMGFSHINSFFGNILGFGISGYLLEKWCPDPKKLDSVSFNKWQNAITGNGQMPAQYEHSYYIWYVFTAIGLFAFIALLIYNYFTDQIDRSRAEKNN